MKIDNVKIYALEESIIASGLPMIEDYDESKFESEVLMLKMPIGGQKIKAVVRAEKLSCFGPGEGHHCFQSGIIVQMNVTAPRYWWPEMQRYHFAEIVSSTSTMHRLKSFLIKAITYKALKEDEKYVDLYGKHFSSLTYITNVNSYIEFVRCLVDAKANKKTISIDELKEIINSLDIEELKANLPEGYLQTARITTNYRQLKTIYMQRYNHRLYQWREFCYWIKSLPMAEELIISGTGTDENENHKIYE